MVELNTDHIADLKSFINSKIDEVNKNLSEFRGYVGTQLSGLKSRIDNLEQSNERVAECFSLINDNKIKLADLESEQSNINFENISLKNSLSQLSLELKSTQDKLDDQVNRGMRSTLIFRGIPEEGNETWDKTMKTLCTTLANIDPSLDLSQLERNIDRAHRGGHSNQNGKPRPIFAKFSSWKQSELVKSAVISHNKNKSRTDDYPTLFVDQMYSEDVARRRREALKERRKLIDDGIKDKLALRFPAKLVVKRAGANDFVLHKEF